METFKRNSLTPVAGAIAAALYPGSYAVAQEAQEAQEAGEYALEEVIVTATKRAVNIQDIPAQIQALTQEALASMGAQTMEDYARFIPSMNIVTYGVTSTVVFRGANTGGSWLSQSTSSVYLDEISITQTGSQPMIRSVDIARVEALAGPQGTLYGSDAQAGTLRIITNQPVMNEFDAVVDLELRGGSESDPSYRASVVFNFPLVEDKLALRIVGFSDLDGGFIDNVPGHTADWHGIDRSDPANNNAPAKFGTLDNAASVEKNWNEADVYGGRAHLLWEMNDNWAATGSIHYQKTESGASANMDPFVGDLEIVRFHDNWREEEFSMYSLKIEGDLGFAQLVGAVSYYDREIVDMADATTYAHYWTASYCHDEDYTPDDTYYAAYYWANPDTGFVMKWPVYCNGPTVESDYLSVYYEPAKEDKLTAELRIQGGGETIEWLVGLYYEDSTDFWLDPFGTPTPGGRVNDAIAASQFQDSIALQYWEWYRGEEFPNVTSSWSAGQNIDWEQKAIFGEFTWHINDSWDLTLGGRYFDRSNDMRYWLNRPGRLHYDEGFYDPDTDLEYREANDGRPMPRIGEETQFVPKVSLAYFFGKDRDKMVYALYSEGVRQGGVNRVRGEPFFPQQYDSDLMKNHELGYRSSFAEGKGRLNMTLYSMRWEDYQLQQLDPSFEPCIDPETGEEDSDLSIPHVCGQPWQTVIANLGEATIDGFNVELDYAPNENWVLGFNYEKMDAETDSDHDLDGDGELNIYKGMRLPLVPDYKAAGWVEHHRPVNWLGAHDFFIRLQWSFTGDSVNQLEPGGLDTADPQFLNPSYNIGDLRAGIVGDDWQVDLFLNNLTDERAIYSYGGAPGAWASAQLAEGRLHHQSAFVARPREFGVRYTKSW